MLPLAGLVARAIIGGATVASAPILGVGAAAAAVAGIAGHAIAGHAIGKMMKDVDHVANNDKYSTKEKDSKILDIVIENISDDIKSTLYTVENVSIMLDISTESIRRKIRSGEIHITELNSRKDGYRLSFDQLVNLSRMFGKEDRLSAYLMSIMANNSTQNEENMDDEDIRDVQTEYKMSNEVMTNDKTAEDDEIHKLREEMLATKLQLCKKEIELVDIQLNKETDLQKIIDLQKQKLSLQEQLIDITNQMNELK